MYSIFKTTNGKFNSNNYINNYFIYSNNNNSNILSGGKLLNAINKIKENKNSDILLIDVEDNNIFLNVSFHYSINLLPFLTQAYEKLNLIDFIKYNTNIYTTDNSKKTKDIIDSIYNMSSYENSYAEIYSDYKKHKQANALNLFGDKYSNKIFINNNLFLDANILFLSNNINKIKTSKQSSYNYYSDYYTSTFENVYMFLSKIKLLSDKQQKYAIHANNITYGNKSYLFKDLLKLVKKQTYSISSSNFSIENEVLYTENVFIRLYDYNIDIKKYNNIFELGLKNNKVLLPVLLEAQNNSLNNFKQVCIKKCNELITGLQTKINFINSIDLTKMYIN